MRTALIIAATAMLGVSGCAHDTAPVTEVAHVMAVDPGGHPDNGYREQPAADISTVSDCAASPAAVTSGIYRCWPSAAGADVCWPAAPGELLCVDDPWEKQLHRVRAVQPLPAVQPTVNPQPFALLLDDGTRCRLRSGGAWGGRDDGYLGAYGCASTALTVLVKNDQEPINRTAPRWTVKVGELGPGDAHFPPPRTRTVATAWFAGDPG